MLRRASRMRSHVSGTRFAILVSCAFCVPFILGGSCLLPPDNGDASGTTDTGTSGGSGGDTTGGGSDGGGSGGGTNEDDPVDVFQDSLESLLINPSKAAANSEDYSAAIDSLVDAYGEEEALNIVYGALESVAQTVDGIDQLETLSEQMSGALADGRRKSRKQLTYQNSAPAITVMYVNGIDTLSTQWEASQIFLERALEGITPAVTVDRDAFYNYSVGQVCPTIRVLWFFSSTGLTEAACRVLGFAADFLEAGGQQIDESRLLAWAGVEYEPSDVADLASVIRDRLSRPDASLIVVAHSQGNSYMQQAMSHLEDSEMKRLRIVSVGTPIEVTPASHVTRVQIETDIIALVGPSGNTSRSLPITGFGIRHHSFDKSYLKPGSESRQKIRRAVADWAAKLSDDLDGDGIRDVVDNCPGVSNADQADCDADGIGDVCDSDNSGCGGNGNQPPVAHDQSVEIPAETATEITLTADDPDTGPDALEFSVASQPSHGTLTGDPPNVSYTPDSGYAGQDSFRFKANDGLADSNVATVAITITTATGNLNVTVQNQNGTSTAGAIVERYTTNWEFIDRKTTNSSGVASWSGIEATCYNLEAYYNGEYWVNDTNVCVPDGGTTNHTLKRNEPYAYDFKVTRRDSGQNVTGGSVPQGTPLRLQVHVTNDSPVSRLVGVQNLRLDRSGGGIDYEWDLAPYTIDADDTRTFTVNVTASNTGTYYRRLDIETKVNNVWVKTDSWASGVAITITTATATGNLNVTVQNQDGTNTAGARVIRYTASWEEIDDRTTNSNGVASWSGIEATCYNLEAYYNGEYWVNDTNICVPANGTKNHTLRRNEPYTYDFRVTIASTGQDVTGSSVRAGTRLRLKVRVRNSSPTWRDVRIAEIKLDRNQQYPWDEHRDHTSWYSVAPNGGTSEFRLLWTPTRTGTYYRSFQTQTHVNRNWVKTDWWAWGTAVTVY